MAGGGALARSAVRGVVRGSVGPFATTWAKFRSVDFRLHLTRSQSGKGTQKCVFFLTRWVFATMALLELLKGDLLVATFVESKRFFLARWCLL